MTTPRSQSRWGIGLVAAIVLFVVTMVTIAAVLMNQDVNLVTDRYYEQELAYQQRIAALERVRATGQPVGVTLRPGVMLLRVPAVATPAEAVGRVQLYRPSDRSADRILDLALDSAWQQAIPVGMLAPGLWRVHVQWSVRGEEYYYEQPVILP